jgi:hypothetical protein
MKLLLLITDFEFPKSGPFHGKARRTFFGFLLAKNYSNNYSMI